MGRTRAGLGLKSPPGDAPDDRSEQPPLKRLDRETGVRWAQPLPVGNRVETFGTGGTSWPAECNQGTEGHCAPEGRAKLTASMQPSPIQHRPHSTAQHSKMRNTICPPRHDNAACKFASRVVGTYPPDLKGCGLSQTWQHIEGGPRRNRRRSALRVSVNVRLPRP